VNYNLNAIAGSEGGWVNFEGNADVRMAGNLAGVHPENQTAIVVCGVGKAGDYTLSAEALAWIVRWIAKPPLRGIRRGFIGLRYEENSPKDLNGRLYRRENAIQVFANLQSVPPNDGVFRRGERLPDYYMLDQNYQPVDTRNPYPTAPRASRFGVLPAEQRRRPPHPALDY